MVSMLSYRSLYAEQHLPHRLPVELPYLNRLEAKGIVAHCAMRFGNEGIYQAPYVQGRGALRREASFPFGHSIESCTLRNLTVAVRMLNFFDKPSAFAQSGPWARFDLSLGDLVQKVGYVRDGEVLISR